MPNEPATPATPQPQPQDRSNNPFLVPETPENNVAANEQNVNPPAQPAAPAAPVMPEGIPASEIEKINTKYGGDVNKYWEGKSNAEKMMHEATTKVKELERELELARNNQPVQQQPVYPAQHQVQPAHGVYPQTHFSTWDEDTRMRFFNEFGKTPEQYDTDMRIMNSAMAPVLEVTANSQIESHKINLRQNNPNFTPEVERDFDALIKTYDPRDRMNPHIINDVLKYAIGKNSETIIQARITAEREALRRELLGNPQTPPPINTPSTGTPPPVNQDIGMSHEVFRNAVAFGNFSEDELRGKLTGGN